MTLANTKWPDLRTASTGPRASGGGEGREAYQRFVASHSLSSGPARREVTRRRSKGGRRANRKSARLNAREGTMKTKTGNREGERQHPHVSSGQGAHKKFSDHRKRECGSTIFFDCFLATYEAPVGALSLRRPSTACILSVGDGSTAVG